ncbi:MAG: outer membrane lipoprotein chaperone LolA [Gemmatimonadaceae bacterium]
MTNFFAGILMCAVAAAPARPGTPVSASPNEKPAAPSRTAPNVTLFAAKQTDPAAAALDKAVAAYAKVRTARATFEQTITNPLTGKRLDSRGQFEQRRPNKFVFRFSDPAGDRIVSDGKHVWVYLPSTTPDQVIRVKLEDGGAGSLDLISEFFESPRERYAVKDAGAALIGGATARKLTLTPRRGDASFTRATVWIAVADGRLLQFEAEEPNGVVRLVRITSFTPNADVSASAFVFKRPKGVRVVERDAIGG